MVYIYANADHLCESRLGIKLSHPWVILCSLVIIAELWASLPNFIKVLTDFLRLNLNVVLKY